MNRNLTRIKTVADLKAFLATVPDNTPVMIDDVEDEQFHAMLGEYMPNEGECGLLRFEISDSTC